MENRSIRSFMENVFDAVVKIVVNWNLTVGVARGVLELWNGR